MKLGEPRNGLGLIKTNAVHMETIQALQSIKRLIILNLWSNFSNLLK